MRLSFLLLSIFLSVFTLRRWLFLFASLKRDHPETTWGSELPQILLIIPLRNEEDRLPALLLHLNVLQYPPDRFRILFINDGSNDRTEMLTQAWLPSHPNAAIFHIPIGEGKAHALNIALEHESFGELIVIFDADERPNPDVLHQLSACFSDSRVGAVNGQRIVENARESWIASYAAFESLVHQWITMRGKDRLQLHPALLGSNCAYRRRAIADVGGFTSGLYLEDSDITLRLARKQWKTRFITTAISRHPAPATIRTFWMQHARWAEGFNQVSGLHGWKLFTEVRLSLLHRLELVLFSSGYLDRVIVLVAALFSFLGFAPKFLTLLLLFNLLTPLIQTVVALKLSRAHRGLWPRLLLLPVFFLLDIAIAVSGVIQALRRTPGSKLGVWRTPEYNRLHEQNTALHHPGRRYRWPDRRVGAPQTQRRSGDP